jgi:RNA polymerase sigma factor (TIGR02999 family)
MAAESSHKITSLLQAWADGDRDALDQLTPLVYSELHRIACRYMAAERPNHTLQATALVHEAYMRLVDAGPIVWNDRAHFFALAARLMRRILVDLARARECKKRGSGRNVAILDEAGAPAAVSREEGPELVAIDEALTRLSEIDPRRGQVVELRFFGGLGVEETAEVLNVSRDTVMRDWKTAKLWLLREIRGERES